MSKILQGSRFIPWLMWAVSTLFFAYQFIMRLAPGLVMPELMQKFSVDASEYGIFAAIYYFAYSGMQIPVALLLDRYGPRLVISVAAFACSLGTLLLIYAELWSMALLGRFLIGAGSAAGFLGASKVITLWFNTKNYSKMIGLTFTFGLLGAVYGGKPVGTLITLYGYETVLATVGYIGLFITTLIYLLVRSPDLPARSYHVDSNASETEMTQFDAGDTVHVPLITRLMAIVTNRKILLLALANFLMVGSLEGFADVWGVPYLMTTRGLLKADAAQLVSIIFVGMLFGGPLLAYLADKLRSNYWVTSASGILMGLIFIILLSFSLHLSLVTSYILFFIIGILCCYQVLVFSIGVSLVPKQLSGLTVAFLNCINMLGGSFFHSLIGQSMDFFWNGALENGIRVYDSHAYTYSLSSIAITAIFGGCLVLLISRGKRS